jgi:glycosyltransferase involved in cell wall biosynthesis
MTADRLVARPPLPAADPATRVTVVVPCYNYGRFLGDAVGSALAQPGVAVDVVIVDDASTDDSRAIAERLAEADARVRMVAHERNRGHVETYNEALALATGEFIVKLDADDLLTPGSLARSAALMTAHSDAAFCYGHPLEFRGDPPPYEPGPVREWTVWHGHAWLKRVLRRGHNVIMQPEVFLRRSAVVASGGYRPQLRWAEDYNWWLRLAWSGSVGWIGGPAQGLYRVHDASLQRSVKDIKLADLRARTAAVGLFFDEHPDAAASLSEIAYTSLVRNAQELAAAARDRADGGREASAAFARIAAELESVLGHSVRRAASGRTGVVGRVARNLQWRLRWQRWSRWGV